MEVILSQERSFLNPAHSVKLKKSVKFDFGHFHRLPQTRNSCSSTGANSFGGVYFSVLSRLCRTARHGHRAGNKQRHQNSAVEADV